MSGERSNSMTTGAGSKGLPVSGLHHAKIPVSDLPTSRAWYERMFGLVPEIEFRDDAGVVRGVAYYPWGGFAIALREIPGLAGPLRGFNPLAMLVATREDLVTVATHLDQLGQPHTGIVQATLGWFLGTADPDGIELRFYTAERHQTQT